MTPAAMVATALLLGGFVATAGTYGLMYCLFRLWGKPALRVASYLSYGALCTIAGMLVALTPLHIGWKALIAASCMAYLAIPPITWRYLERLHRGERASHDPGFTQHVDRHSAGLLRRA